MDFIYDAILCLVEKYFNCYKSSSIFRYTIFYVVFILYFALFYNYLRTLKFAILFIKGYLPNCGYAIILLLYDSKVIGSVYLK